MIDFTLDKNIKNILNHIHAGVLYCKNDEYSSILYANDYFYTIIGYSKEEVETLFNNHFASMVIDDVSEILVDVADAISNGKDLDFEYRMRRKNGSIVWIHDTAKYDRENDCWYVTIMDITEMKSVEYERQKLNTYLNNLPNNIIITDVDQKIVYKNNKAKECSYYNQDVTHLDQLINNHMLGTDFPSLIQRTNNNEHISYETRFICNGDLIGHDKNLLIPIQDKNKNITNYMQVSENLLMYSDALTKFPTRAMLEHYYEVIVGLNPQLSVHLCIIDIDNFKLINDSYGHVVGDKAIHLTASRISEIMGSQDYACRFGGDEFIVLFVNQSIESIMDKCNQIIHSTKQPIYMYDHSFSLTYSIGIASSTPDNNDYEELFQKADYALYEVKSRGKGHILLYNEACSLY